MRGLVLSAISLALLVLGTIVGLRFYRGAKEFKVVARIDTPEEMNYYKNGGILPYVLRQLVGGRA